MFSLKLSNKGSFKCEAFPFEKNSTSIDHFNCYVAIHSFENV